MKKRLLKVIKRTFLLTLIIILGAVGYLHHYVSDWSDICTEAEMHYNAKLIDSTKSLPDNFYKVWDKLYPDSRNISMNEHIVRRFLNDGGYIKSSKDCKCEKIGYEQWDNDNFQFKFNWQGLQQTAGYIRFGFGLENYVSTEKCYDFWLNHCYSKNNGKYFKGLDEFSQELYQKEIKDLSEEEVVMIIAYRVMGPYSPRKTEKVIELKNRFWKRLHH